MGRYLASYKTLRGWKTRQSSRRLPGLLGYVVALAVVTPSLLWVILDKSAWGGDQSQYGRAALELFYSLSHSPGEWPREMLEVFFKPPAIYWVGQLFVPVGYVLGSVDIGLLFSILISQCLILILMYKSIWRACHKAHVAVIGCLVIASAPLFVGLSTVYMVESIQTLAVAWFVLIMSSARKSSRVSTLSQLLVATAFAALSKETTLLFCLWPGLAALACAASAEETQHLRDFRVKRLVGALVPGITLSLAAVTWYSMNVEHVFKRVLVDPVGATASVWGKTDSHVNNLWYWLGAGRTSLMLQGVLPFVLLICIAALVSYCRRRGLVARQLTTLGVVAAMEMATVLLVFSISSFRIERYLLPLLPYLALLISWAVAQINRPVIASLATLVLVSQLVLVHGQALGLVSRSPGSPVQWVNGSGRSAAILDSIVARTCTDRTATSYENVLAIDTGSGQGDWLAPEPANYVAAKQAFPRERQVCYYGYAGGTYFGSTAAEAWEQIVSRGVRYFIVKDPTVYPVPGYVHNQTLDRRNLPILLSKVQDSGLFVREVALVEDPGILIFRRIDLIAIGRQMSDEGDHERAIGTLLKATSLEPSNAEAWANLALAYSRRGQQDEAVVACRRVLTLNPHHYWALHHLALDSYNAKRWAEAVSLERLAVEVAADDEERVAGLALMARAYLELGSTAEACSALREAHAIDRCLDVPDVIEALERTNSGW